MDLVLENARIVDGTGSPWYRGAVGIADGRIERVVREREHGMDADETVDVDERVVCPGFVDAHSHSDLELFADPTLEPKVRQGVTTEILGQDGFSMAPMYREGGAAEWREHLKALAGDVDREWTWGSVTDYLDAVDAAGVAPNVATLVGHGTVRYNLVGMDDREPTEGELEEMAELVDEGLEGGAVGFSTGLIYPPQVNADTDEVRHLAARLAPYRRPFVAHIRSEGRWLWEALDEFVDVGAEAGIPLHLSHYKVSGTEQQGRSDRANALLAAARERGVDVTADQYPYTAGNTMLSSVLPPWVHADGPAAALEKLTDESVRARIRRDVAEWRIDGWENHGVRTGWENIVVTNIESEENERYDGRSVADIANERGVDPVTVVCDLLVDEEMEVAMILHAMDEADVRNIMTNELVAVATDGLFGGRPHPRVYGSFPRVLGHYVREQDLLSLEAAVRKMTSLPARAMGLDAKGLVRPGADADLVVFDPVLVEGPATFDRPARYPRGILHVLVDGEFVVRDGEVTGATPGEAIRR